jgi:hypothetical protein
MQPEVLMLETARVAVVIVGCFLWTSILWHLWPPLFSPFSLTSLWETKGGISDWVRAGLPVLMWGAGFTAIVAALTRNSAEENREAGGFLISGWYISLLAGVTEEIRYRWLFFMLSIASVKITNFILGGFVGHILGPERVTWLQGIIWGPICDLLTGGILKWFYLYLIGPVFNVITLGTLSQWLVNPEIWAVGLALLTINGRFRDGHAYLGWVGILNSWVLGFYFYWLTLTWGLPAAIAVHVLYDGLIFSIQSFDRLIERLFGGGR